jgi:hypothetical protein
MSDQREQKQQSSGKQVGDRVKRQIVHLLHLLLLFTPTSGVLIKLYASDSRFVAHATTIMRMQFITSTGPSFLFGCVTLAVLVIDFLHKSKS